MTSYLRDRFLSKVDSGERELLSLQLQTSRLAPNKPSLSTLSLLEEIAGQCASHYKNHTRTGPSPTILRAVPSTPNRVLDAPGLVDDFYLNIFDWSVRNVLAVALGSSVYLWNAGDGTVKELLSLHENQSVTSLSWIHDGKSIAVGTLDGFAQIWDVEKIRKLRTMIATPGFRVGSMSWHRHLLSTGSKNGAVLTHDVRIAKHLIISHNTRSQNEVCGLSWSPDGQQLATGSNDNFIRIWDINKDKVIPTHTLEGHRSAVRALSWCPWRGNALASGGGSLDRTIRVWDTSTGHCMDMIDASSPVSSIVWSRCSKEIISAHGATRNNISIWKVDATCRNIDLSASVDRAHDARILQMCLSPDGRTVATAGADESIKFWSLFPSSHSKSHSKQLLDNPPPHSQNPSSSSPFSLRTKSFR